MVLFFSQDLHISFIYLNKGRVKSYEKKLDMYLIYLIYIFELIYTMSAMYFNNSIVTHKIEIFENIYQIAYCMIFIVGILYILLLIYKVGHHESIDLKKIQVYYLESFLWILYYMAFYYSYVSKFTCYENGLYLFLIHLLICIKEKQLFVLEK